MIRLLRKGLIIYRDATQTHPRAIIAIHSNVYTDCMFALIWVYYTNRVVDCPYLLR
jgi:hypothetical protein